MSTQTQQYIVCTPGTCGGRPRIAGHRIRVQDIVQLHEREGRSADEIVSDFPDLTLAEVYAALSYYFDHRDEIEDQIQQDLVAVADAMKTHQSLLRQKLAQTDG